MLFSEITMRTKIIIIVTNGSDMQARFVSKVMRNLENNLLAIPFKYKGMRINFQGKDVKIHMEVRDDNGQLWTFRNCKIGTVKKDGLVYHRIVSGMTKGIENRRGGRRFHLWEPATFEVDGVQNTIFTNIRDIGPEGFSFVIDVKKKLGIKEGANVKATIKGREGEELIMQGLIVRTEPMEKYTIYGCKMDNPSEEVTKYVKYLEKKNVVVDADI